MGTVLGIFSFVLSSLFFELPLVYMFRSFWLFGRENKNIFFKKQRDGLFVFAVVIRDGVSL